MPKKIDSILGNNILKYIKLRAYPSSGGYFGNHRRPDRDRRRDDGPYENHRRARWLVLDSDRPDLSHRGRLQHPKIKTKKNRERDETELSPSFKQTRAMTLLLLLRLRLTVLRSVLRRVPLLRVPLWRIPGRWISVLRVPFRRIT